MKLSSGLVFVQKVPHAMPAKLEIQREKPEAFPHFPGCHTEHFSLIQTFLSWKLLSFYQQQEFNASTYTWAHILVNMCTSKHQFMLIKCCFEGGLTRVISGVAFCRRPLACFAITPGQSLFVRESVIFLGKYREE